MKTLLTLTLGVFMVLPSTATRETPASSRYMALFCPECWTYLYGPGSTNMMGNCAACGKYPLELEVRTMKWFWCGTQNLWLAEACNEAALRHCCTRWESMAAVTRPGPGLHRSFYCPEHRRFAGMRLPLLQLMVCPEGGKPMATAWAARRAWYWCGMEGTWAATPCPEEKVQHCCVKFEGLLLATPESGPLARQQE